MDTDITGMVTKEEARGGGWKYRIGAGDRTYYATDWGCIEYSRGDSTVILQVSGDGVREWVRWLIYSRWGDVVPAFATNADAAVARMMEVNR